MDFKIIVISVLCLSISLASGNPQRAINALPTTPSKSGSFLKSPLLGDNPKHAKIMKQISKVNDDGSYTFGYESDDGSFRVETRSKDGVVKGKYGYVDANGELKVMEYTAGEKSENSSDDEPEQEEGTSPRPAPVPQLRYAVRQTKALPPFPRAGPIRPARDQNFAAQTQAGKVTSVSSSSGPDDEKNSEENDDSDDEPEKDVNNGQYFRALPGSSSGPSPQGISQRQGQDGPQYVPSHTLGGPNGQGFPPSQYSPQGAYPGFGPGPSSDPRSQPQFQYSGGRPLSPYSGGSGGGSPYSSGSPYSGGPPPTDYTRSQTPNVQIQFRGSPADGSEQEGPYYPQGQGSYRSAPLTNGRSQGQGQQYVPNLELDGYSEDADEDGYVDDPPNSLSPNREAAEAQEKQGVAVNAIGGGRTQRPGEAYRPQVLGPQGVLQGGQIQPQFPSRQFPSLSQGGRPIGQGPSGSGFQGFPQLSDEQIQQLFAQQGQSQFSPQGPFLGQGQGQGQGSPSPFQFGGQGPSQSFPSQGQSFPSQGGQGQGQGFPQFSSLNRPASTSSLQGGQGQGLPFPQQGQFPQQNPFLSQGQYFPGQGQGQNQGSSDELAGFPPQFLPQGQGFPQQFPGQGQGQGGQFSQFPPQSFAPQGFQPGPPPQGFQGQGQAPSSRPSQGSSGQGPVSQQGGSGGGSPLQSGGFPFDFSPYGGQGGFVPQFQGQGQGFPPSQPQFQGQGFPTQGLSQQQLAAIQQQQQFSPQIQGFVPGRFPQGQGGLPPQYFSGQGSGSPSFGGSGSGSGGPPSPVSIQLGGGQPRPVQPASSSSGTEERKQVTNNSKTPTKSN